MKRMQIPSNDIDKLDYLNPKMNTDPKCLIFGLSVYTLHNF